MTFSEKLRELRKESSLTQKQVAQQLGISTTCYSGYEQGYREPDLKTLYKICKFYNVSSDYLIHIDEN